MSTIAPGPLETVTGVGDPVAVIQSNFEQITLDLYKQTPTYTNGVPAATPGPPSTGDHILNELYTDSLGAKWRCDTAGTPGIWRQVTFAAVADFPANGLCPLHYLIVMVVDNLTNIGATYTLRSVSPDEWHWVADNVVDESITSSLNDIPRWDGDPSNDGGILFRFDDGDGGISYKASLGTQEGILHVNSDMTQLGDGTPVKSPEGIAGLTAGRLSVISEAGKSLANSVIRDDGTRICVGGTPSSSQLGTQLIGGLSLIYSADPKAGWIQTDIGELTLNSGNSLAINFKIGGSNGWRIMSNSILEAIGAQTIRTSTGDLTLATNGGDGSIVLVPSGNGLVRHYKDGGLATVQVQTYRNASGGSLIQLLSARGTKASPSTSQSGDNVGQIIGYGYNSTASAFQQCAYMLFTIESSAGDSSTDMPGCIIFATTPDGSSSPSERARISNNGNVGIGGTANSKAILDCQSTTKGWLPPRMTTTQKNAISSPPEGLEVYDTTLHKKCVYTGSAWETVTSS